MEDFEAGVNAEEVAAPQEEVVTQEVQDTSVPSEVADPKPVQDTETNARYAEQRRKQELQEYRQKAETHEQNLNRVARLSGYESHQEMIDTLDARDQAQKLGMDEETYRQYLHPVNTKLQQAEQKIQQLEHADLQRQVNAQLADLKKDPDFSKYEDQTIEAWKKNPAFQTLQDAYEFVSYKDKIAAVATKAEQETIRKLQQNQTTSTGSLSVGGDITKPSIKDMSKDDFEAMILKAKRGEKVDI